MQEPSSRCPPGVHCLSLQAASLPCLTCAPAQVLAPLAEVLPGARSLPSWYIRAGGGKASNAQTGPRQDFPGHNLRTRRSLCARGPCASLARRPGVPGGQRCHSSASFCAPPALRSAPTTPAPGRRLLSIALLRVHTASSLHSSQAPAGLLQRCRPGAACCWALALRSRALLLLMAKVSVGPVGLELDLWWAEYFVCGPPELSEGQTFASAVVSLPSRIALPVSSGCLASLPHLCSSPGTGSAG